MQPDRSATGAPADVQRGNADTGDDHRSGGDAAAYFTGANTKPGAAMTALDTARLPTDPKAIVHAARRLRDVFADDAATAVLEHLLRHHDPRTARPDPDLIDAALVYAVVAVDRPDQAQAWAEYAHAAALSMHGPGHLVTWESADIRADHLAYRQRYAEAAGLWHTIICAEPTTHAGIDPRWYNDVRAKHALALHGAGHCLDALNHIHDDITAGAQDTANSRWLRQRLDPHTTTTP